MPRSAPPRELYKAGLAHASRGQEPTRSQPTRSRSRARQAEPGKDASGSLFPKSGNLFLSNDELLDEARRTWQAAHKKYQHSHGTVEAAEEAQAREQYFRFKALAPSTFSLFHRLRQVDWSACQGTRDAVGVKQASPGQRPGLARNRAPRIHSPVRAKLSRPYRAFRLARRARFPRALPWADLFHACGVNTRDARIACLPARLHFHCAALPRGAIPVAPCPHASWPVRIQRNRARHSSGEYACAGVASSRSSACFSFHSLSRPTRQNHRWRSASRMSKRGTARKSSTTTSGCARSRTPT